MNGKARCWLIIVCFQFAIVGVAIPSANAKSTITATIGSTISDGEMSFKVVSFKCGISTIGTGLFSEKALGQFCVVTFTMKAAKKNAVNYFYSNQKGITKSGSKVEAKSALLDDFKSMVDLNPGISITTKIAFDVAKNDPLAQIEFHDSMFSGGVLVSLVSQKKK
jgi:hypothetical protein